MFHRRIRPLLATLAIALISGCANMPSGEPSPELADKSKGVVAASVTLTRGTPTTDAWFYIRKKGEAAKDKFYRLSARELFSSGLGNLSSLPIFGGKPDFPDTPNRNGRVLAISIEPGEYELHSWTLYVQLLGGYGYISPKVPPPPLAFLVKAGEVTYLGSLHGETLMGRNIIGLPVPGSGNPDIQDKAERDIPLFKQRFPMLLDWPITPVKLDGQSWLPR